MTDFKKQVGDLIREARKARGITQKEAADLLNIDVSTYNRYESGIANLSIETIQRVALTLHMPSISLVIEA